MSGHWKTKHVLPYHVYYTERNNGVLSEHGSSKFQCQFHPSLLRGESFHSQNTHVTFPWSNCPKLDRQQAINIPYSFTKSVSSFVFVRHGLDPWKILHVTDKTIMQQYPVERILTEKQFVRCMLPKVVTLYGCRISLVFYFVFYRLMGTSGVNFNLENVLITDK